MRTSTPLIVAACLIAAGSSLAAPPSLPDAKDRQILQAFCGHADKLPGSLSADYCRKLAGENSEGYCWLICPQWDMLLTCYRLTGDTKYLDRFVEVFGHMRAAMTKGPDGYLGWYGKALGIFQNPKNPGQPVDVVITSFSVVRVLCEFLEIVAADEALAAKYGKYRDDWLDLMENHLVKKWHARGRFVDLGKGGMIIRSHAGLRDTKASLTHPHNKHSKVVQALLALYRVTGRHEHMADAIRLGTRFKHCLTLKDGHYEWNYWDPAGAWDVSPADAGKWKHWIGPEHRSGYYSLSLSQAVALYHHGVVFDRKDIDRFLKTQMEMCWNGDLDRPTWHRVDRSRGKQSGEYICAALAPFNEKIYQYLYTGPRQASRVKNMNHGWQGGPVANGYLAGKYVYCPAAKDGKPMYAEFGRRFAANPKNRKLLDDLRHDIAAPGYKAPRTPADMNPMPSDCPRDRNIPNRTVLKDALFVVSIP